MIILIFFKSLSELKTQTKRELKYTWNYDQKRDNAKTDSVVVSVLISMAVASVVLIGVLGLVYHKYSKKELAFVPPKSSSRKVSYGFDGADDVNI